MHRGLNLQRLLQINLGIIDILLAQGTYAGIEIGNILGRVERVSDRFHELRDRFIYTVARAEKSPVIVAGLGIGRLQIDGAPEVGIRLGVFTQRGIDQAQAIVCQRIARIDFTGFGELFERDGNLALRIVAGTKLSVYAGAFALLRFCPVVGGLTGASCQHDYTQYAKPLLHVTTSREIRLNVRRVLSCTLPASCPHAASMSSPRVFLVVTTYPACISTSRKRRIFSGLEV